MDAYKFSGTCMISPDKDLLINPFESYCLDTGRFLTLPEGDTFGWIQRKQWFTDSGKPRSKIIGKGSKFFWAQMLMGDQADNVQGILKYNGKLCGEAGAYDVLGTLETPDEAANAVIDGYRVINQNVIAEGNALWLKRNKGDDVILFLSEHNLSPANEQFVYDCIERGYKEDVDTVYGT